MEATHAPFRIETEDAYSILVLQPGISAEQPWSDISRIGDEILRNLDQMEQPALIVDLSRIDFMGSAQVALLVRIWKSIKSRHGHMIIQVNSPNVRKVLTIAGLHNIWRLTTTRDEAAAGLYQGGVAPVRRRELPFTSGLVCVGLGVAALLAPRLMHSTGHPYIWLGVQFAISTVILVMGLMLTVSAESRRRTWGMGLVLAGAIFGVVAALSNGVGRTAAVDAVTAAPPGAVQGETKPATAPAPESLAPPAHSAPTSPPTMHAEHSRPSGTVVGESTMPSPTPTPPLTPAAIRAPDVTAPQNIIGSPMVSPAPAAPDPSPAAS